MRRDGLTEPAIWVALALSVLTHVAALWRWPLDLSFSSEKAGKDKGGGALVVQLAPPPKPPSVFSPPPSPSASRSPAPAQRAQRPATPAPPTPPAPPAPRVAPQPPPRPPVLALNQPAPSSPPVQSAPKAPPAGGDLSSYIEARRQARGQTAPAPASVGSTAPGEDENARANRIAAANVGSDRTPAFGRQRGYGVFDIRRVGYDSAEFLFYGWSKEISRNTTQLVEVQKGNNSDIRVAVVRKMIAIIRERETEDFVWESKRLNRNVTLSARARDNSGLEDFMMQEFFSGGPP